MRPEPPRILDKFAVVRGYHRKHAIRLPSGRAMRRRTSILCCPGLGWIPALKLRSASARWLLRLWEVTGRVHSKLLQPIIVVLSPVLERRRTRQREQGCRR